MTRAEAWGYMLSPLRGEEPAREDGLSTREIYPVANLKRCFVRRSKKDLAAARAAWIAESPNAEERKRREHSSFPKYQND
jgi:hypothetical protein